MNAEEGYFRLAGKGITGILATGGGVGVSLLQQVEAWLRLASLVGGCVASVLTVVSLWKGLRKKRKD